MAAFVISHALEEDRHEDDSGSAGTTARERAPYASAESVPE
jgi:hypothetical protein